MTYPEVMNYCEEIINDLHTFERHELASPNCSRDVAIAAWVIRALANPKNLDSERILNAIVERRRDGALQLAEKHPG